MIKENKTYYFSVEGETELIYLNWLMDTLNQTEDAIYSVKFVMDKSNPWSFSKRQNIIFKTTIVHVFDYESNQQNHINKFQGILSDMKKASNNRNIIYKTGYSNYTFELWLILHKMNCNAAKNDRSKYLDDINKAFNTNFLSLHDFKHKSNLISVFKTFTLEDVRKAISRAKEIMINYDNLNYPKIRHCRYLYCTQNPSLDIHLRIGKILKDLKIQ